MMHLSFEPQAEPLWTAGTVGYTIITVLALAYIAWYALKGKDLS